MTRPEDRLRDLFIQNADPIPDVTSVYVGTMSRARVHRRRRRAAQLAGGAVVTAGIAVGAVGLSSSLTPTHRATTVIAAAGQPAGAPPAAGEPPTTAPPSTTDPAASRSPFPSVSPVPSADNDNPTPAEVTDVNAFFAAGYTYDDAVALARTWNDSVPFTAKIQGGQQIRAGETLPIPPAGAPATNDPSARAAQESQAAQTSRESQDESAFFSAGYTYQEATKLAALWGLPNAYQAKIMAGQKLLAGKPLPFRP